VKQEPYRLNWDRDIYIWKGVGGFEERLLHLWRFGLQIDKKNKWKQAHGVLSGHLIAV
jgi:hypothetical protein